MRQLIFGGLISAAGGLSAACNHLFYYPDRSIYSEPSQYPFVVKALEIPREGLPALSAWLMNDSPQSKGLILHFHGNAQNLSAHAGFSSWLGEAGYTVLIFDYSGYGLSPGQPTQPRLIADSLAVAAWVKKERRWQKPLPFIVFAQSLGGAVATTSLAESSAFAEAVDLLIVESSFDSYARVAMGRLKSNPITYLFSPLALAWVSDYRKPGDAVARLKMKKIFVHGNADGVVPFENGKALYDAALPPKEFWEIPFGNHTEAFVAGSPYRQQLLDRLQEIFGR